MHKTLDTQYVYLELRDNLLIATYKKDIRITLEIAKEIVESWHEFIEFKQVVALVYNQGVRSIDKKARDYLSSNDGIGRLIIAGALVLDSPFSSFLGNFYLSVSKPKMPTRIFTKTEPALKWLQQFRNKLRDGQAI